MRAVFVEGLGKMTVKDAEIPQVKEGTILLKVLACAVCGSDLRIFVSGNNRVSYPAIIGHEMVGEIVGIGKGVERYKEGDRVAIGADIPCGKCPWCLNDIGNCCDDNYAVGYQFSGGYAQYCLLEPVVVKYGPICKIPKGFEADFATIAEPLGCCINGLERAFFQKGKSVLVFGAGPVGILLIKLAKAWGAALTVMCDIDQDRLRMAEIARADVEINTSQENLKARVMTLTQQKGIDAIFTACPSPEAQEQAIGIVSKRGCVNLFGGLAGGSPKIAVDSNFIHYREAYVTGSHGSTPRQHRHALELIVQNKINVADLITHRFPLEEIHQAFDVVKNKRGLKVLVKPNESM
ncbi:MAG: alcohol dehydrogenase catalytic domain-containing protein [Candidatus Omnitrophica bacterium]|nr:alcohol dehydrogenase catalytic domain-containing protein [Candidatus Omnitrophota bacterium]